MADDQLELERHILVGDVLENRGRLTRLLAAQQARLRDTLSGDAPPEELAQAPRDKLLAYALHFAQQYGTAGEAGTGVALLEEYTRAYTQQYGLKAVDRRLVTLRPQLLELRCVLLAREKRVVPRGHRLPHLFADLRYADSGA